MNSRRNLANASRADSRTREAEELLESVLANYERTLAKFIVQTGSAATLRHDPISMVMHIAVRPADGLVRLVRR
jgi:hypothetical protein